MSFWLPLRSFNQDAIAESFVKKMDFGGAVFDPEKFENELFAKMNRIEFRKVEECK
jgi:hypothetical protein